MLADDFSRRNFQMHFFLGALRVKKHILERILYYDAAYQSAQRKIEHNIAMAVRLTSLHGGYATTQLQRASKIICYSHGSHFSWNFNSLNVRINLLRRKKACANEIVPDQTAPSLIRDSLFAFLCKLLINN